MRTVAFMDQKSGIGKSTISFHLAVLAEQEGERVLFVDTDPKANAVDWWRARTVDAPQMVAIDASQLPETLKVAKVDGISLCIINVVPHAQKESADAADVVLVLCRPTTSDMCSIASVVETLKSVKTPGAIVLNQCPPGRSCKESSIVSKARDALSTFRLPIFPGGIGLWPSLSQVLVTGEAVVESDPKGLAATELRALWKWTTKGGFRDALIAKRKR